MGEVTGRRTSRRAWRSLEVVHGMIYLRWRRDEEVPGGRHRAGADGLLRQPIGGDGCGGCGRRRGRHLLQLRAVARARGDPPGLDARLAGSSAGRSSPCGRPGAAADAQRRGRRLTGGGRSRRASACTAAAAHTGQGGRSTPATPRCRGRTNRTSCCGTRRRAAARKYRSDAHVAALLLEGLSGLGALVQHAGTGQVPATVLRTGAASAWSQEARRGTPRWASQQAKGCGSTTTACWPARAPRCASGSRRPRIGRRCPPSPRTSEPRARRDSARSSARSFSRTVMANGGLPAR